jgi:hypothetical protein
MRRILSNLMRGFRPTAAARTLRRAPHRVCLRVEGLEERTVLSTAMQAGSTLLVTADPGVFTRATRGHGAFRRIREILFQADAAQPAKLDVLDNGALLGQFTIASINSVQVSVAGLDAVTVDDSNGFPFAAGTNVSLFGSGSLNSLVLTGSRVVRGDETYTAGRDGRFDAQAGSLALGGVTFQFSPAIASVTDEVEVTPDSALHVAGYGPVVSLNGQDGVTQTLSGLSEGGGGGDSLTYNNNYEVDLDAFAPEGVVSLNATAAATGEELFQVDMRSGRQTLNISGTPSTVDTAVIASSFRGVVQLQANSGRVSITGGQVFLGRNVAGGVDSTAGIQQDVFVNDVYQLAVYDDGNSTTQEHVTVTESTISGTGLFGTDAVTVHYSNVYALEIETGQLANTFSVIGSRPGAQFESKITIDDGSDLGLNVLVALDGHSGLHLTLLNTFVQNPAAASLFISAPNGMFSKTRPDLPDGAEDVTFAGGLASELVYKDFTDVTLS